MSSPYGADAGTLGREGLLRELVAQARKASAQRRHLALAAPRKCGRSSIVRAFAEGVGGRGVSVVLVDLAQRSPEDLAEQFLRGMAMNLVARGRGKKAPEIESGASLPEMIERLPRKLAKAGREMLDVWERWTGRMSEAELFGRCLELPDLFQRAAGGTVWMVCDNFDRLAALLGEEFLAGTFRECLGRNRNVRWLIAGTPPALMERLIQRPGGPLEGLFTFVPFRGIAFSEGLKLMAGVPAAKALPASFRSFLIALTGSHPFYLGILADGLDQVRRERGTKVKPEPLVLECLVRELFADAGRLNLYFEGLLATTLLGWRAPELYLGMLEAVARGQSSLAGISHYIRREAPALSRQVQNILDSGLLAKEGTRYYIPDPLLRLWLRHVYLVRHVARPLGETGPDPFRRHFQNLLTDFLETSEAETVRRIAQVLAASDGKAALPGGVSADEEELGVVPRFNQVEVHQKLAEETFDLVARRENDYWLFAVFESAPASPKLTSFAARAERIGRTLPDEQHLYPIVVSLGSLSKSAARTASKLELTVWDREDVNLLAECYGQLPIVG